MIPFTLETYGRLSMQTLFEPRAVAKEVLSWRLSGDVLWSALTLIVCLSVLLTAVGSMLAPVTPEVATPAYSPFAYAGLVGMMMVLSTLAVWLGGRMLGGVGTFEQTFALMLWLQAALLSLQALQVVTLLMGAFLVLVSLAIVGVALVCTVVFIDEVHGFNSIGKSIGALVLGAVLAMPILVMLSPLLTGSGVPTASEL